MTCPRTVEVERALDPRELRAFCDHARGCADCGKLLDRVERAYRLLREEVAPLSPARRVELLAKIEAAARKPRFDLRWPVLAVASALIVAVFASWIAKREDGPRLARGIAIVGTERVTAGELLRTSERAMLEPGARVELGAHAIEIAERTVLSIAPGPELIALAMEEGSARFEVAPLGRSMTFVVETELARFEVIGTRFVLDVAPERIVLAVEEGKVRAVPRDGGEARIVGAGERVVVERVGTGTGDEIGTVTGTGDEIGTGNGNGDRPRVAQRKVEARAIAEAKQVVPREEVKARPGAAERLAEARSIVTRDAVKARELAKGVLEDKPEPSVEIGALLVLADAHRRTGEWSAAAAAYREVARHRNGAPYAEEALLRRARILSANGAEAEALAALAEAERRFANGTLAPERAVLEARIHLAKNDPESAATALERVGEDRTLAVLRARVDVAEKLSSVERARALVTPVLESNVSADLIARARMIDSRSSGNR